MLVYNNFQVENLHTIELSFNDNFKVCSSNHLKIYV